MATGSPRETRTKWTEERRRQITSPFYTHVEINVYEQKNFASKFHNVTLSIFIICRHKIRLESRV